MLAELRPKVLITYKHIYQQTTTRASHSIVCELEKLIATILSSGISIHQVERLADDRAMRFTHEQKRGFLAHTENLALQLQRQGSVDSLVARDRGDGADGGGPAHTLAASTGSSLSRRRRIPS